jgi:2-methylcitrate dehydratase PrpD
MPRAVNDPAMTKDTTGWGAFMGTSCAMLAARGFTALDSEFMQASEELELGSRWELLELYLKPYPCCRWSQPGIDAALRLRADGLDPARIDEIEVRTFAAAADLSWRRPENTEEMQYSLAWPVATALARGRFGVDEVLTGFADADAARLVERMRLVVDPELTERFPGRRLTALVVRMDDGTELRTGAVEAGGEPGAGDWEDVVGAKARAFLDPSAVLPVPQLVDAPAGLVTGRSRDELVDLLAFGLSGPPGGSTA